MQVVSVVRSLEAAGKSIDYHILLTTETDEVINNPKHSFYVSARLAHLTCTATATTLDRAKARATHKLVTRLNKNQAYLEHWAKDYRPKPNPTTY